MMMMFSGINIISCLLLIYVCLGLTAGAGSPYPAPRTPNCADYECPAYTVIWANNEMEIRNYNPAHWVSTPYLPAPSYADGLDTGYLILWTYYDGNNRQNKTMDMTLPILVDVYNNTYKAYFYLSGRYQNNPPQPFSPDMIISETLPWTWHAAVRRYAGPVSEINMQEQLDELKDGIRGTPYEQDDDPDIDRCTVASYNLPSETTNLVNEIILWLD